LKLETIISSRTDIYFDYQLIDAMTGKILVDRVYDKTYKKSNKKEWEEYYRFEPYKHWTVKEWLIAEGKMMFYISPVKQKSRPTFSDEPARKLSTEETQ
jgi:hypothetical protein